MSKTQCEKKKYEAPEEAKYKCKKCGRLSEKKKKVCKSGKLN